MSKRKGPEIQKLATGIPGLDEILGGGLPEYSFNLVAGAPGAGKTTLVHQLMFANASLERPAIYFTVLGEPALKMLRYQQQMAFFDPEKVGTFIRFVDLSQTVLDRDLSKVLEVIVSEVEQINPGIVVVDSFRTMLRGQAGSPEGHMDLQGFLQRLALHLTSWQATTFLVGEYQESEMQDNPVFTIADGIIWMAQSRDRNSVVRKLQAMKVRGTAPMPGLHTFRISDEGLQVFPRIQSRPAGDRRPPPGVRLGMGVAALDEMLGGGIPAGDAVLLSGPSGTGKTVLGTHFVTEGIQKGERAVLAVFEEHPQDYVARAKDIGFDLEKFVRDGDLRLIYLRPLDLSADEILQEVQQTVAESGATRLVIDSLNGLEIALAPTFREDFQESLYRMISGLTGGGVTIMMMVEVTESFSSLSFSPHAISYLSQNIIFLRYVELQGRLEKVLVIVKMRRSGYSQEMRRYTITSSGVRLGVALAEYEGILTGVPTRRQTDGHSSGVVAGLIDSEMTVLTALRRLGEASEEAIAVEVTILRADIPKALARLEDLELARRREINGTVTFASTSPSVANK
ncbi:MAG TPA: ATPase domain-containing protein [Polyangia bacterium]|jgi:circadian clock protein KaiC|nr:ATPase domain-containing protein [Polyangia bacterium]